MNAFEPYMNKNPPGFRVAEHPWDGLDDMGIRCVELILTRVHFVSPLSRGQTYHILCTTLWLNPVLPNHSYFLKI